MTGERAMGETKPNLELRRTPSADPDRPLILVVDPQDQPRNFLRLYLESEGYRVAEARTGRDALQVARNRSPHAVIAEMSLPGLGGMELFAALRALPALREIPFVMVSGQGDEKDRDYAEKLGVDGFLAKPVDPARLLEILKSLLSR